MVYVVVVCCYARRQACLLSSLLAEGKVAGKGIEGKGVTVCYKLPCMC